jgi:hypothetical protein
MRNAQLTERVSACPERGELYRADVDHNGDWYVWRQLGANGWATHRRCDSREAARELAAVMNSRGESTF